MLKEGIASLLGKNEDDRFVSVDIGTSAIKIMEMERRDGQQRLINAGMAPTPANSIHNNAITKPDQIAQTIRAILDANDIQATKAITAIPGPSAFTKKITIGTMPIKDLQTNIAFEAGNYIPHQIDAVHLDFQVLRNDGGNTMDLLLVAVKNEVVSSFVSALEQAGLEPAIADVDYFALENMFEINYPEEREKTVALINIGARYTSINIIQDGESLFTGDVAVGGRLYTDALCETLGMEPAVAEEAKMGRTPEGFDLNVVKEAIERTTEHVASELHRQLGFFWSAAATDRSIESIYLCGGGAQVHGLAEELSTKTGCSCNIVDVFRNVNCTDSFDEEFLEEIAPSMAVSIGLASRRFGDKSNATS